MGVAYNAVRVVGNELFISYIHALEPDRLSRHIQRCDFGLYGSAEIDHHLAYDHYQEENADNDPDDSRSDGTPFIRLCHSGLILLHRRRLFQTRREVK